MKAARWLVLGYLAVVLGPLAALAWQAGGLLAAGGTTPAQLGLSSRLGMLLLRSGGLAAAVATACVVLGLLLALSAWHWRKGALAWLRWTPLALLALPPYLHALAFQAALRWLRGLPIPGAEAVQPGGAVCAWIVLTLWLFPLAYALVLAGLESIDGELLDSARLYARPWDALRLVVLPLLRPYLLAAWALCVALCLADYGTAALFLVNTYPLELHALYSLGQPPGLVLLAGWPLMALALAAIWLGLSTAARLELPAAGRAHVSALPSPCWLAGLQQAVLIVGLVALAGLPLAALVDMLAGGWPTAMAADMPELGYSLLVATVCAVAAPLLAWPLAHLLLHYRWAWLLAALPLAVPAPLTGSGLILLWNTETLGWGYGTMLMPVLAALARFTPVAVLLLAAALAGRDNELADSARLFERNPLRRWLAVELPLALPGLVLAGLTAACLALAELGATLLVAPPGRASAVMRIYNYLHYGAGGNVALLALALGVCGLALALAALAVAGWRRRDLRSAGLSRN